MKRFYTTFLLATLLTGWVSTVSGSTKAVPLTEAIRQSVNKIAGEVPKGSRVAIVAFTSENDRVSDYIMEELAGALVNRGFNVADRQNLEYLFKEHKLQASVDINEKDAKTIGRFLGAELVISGELTDIGGSYRYRTRAVHVKKATLASVTQLTVSADAETKRILATVASQQTIVRSKYSVSADKTPQTAGAFLDRGLMFTRQNEYDKAIADFNSALKLNPNFIEVYFRRGYTYLLKSSPISKNELDSAIADFNKVIQHIPDDAYAYLNLGFIYLIKGEPDNVIENIDRAIQLGLKKALLYYCRGDAYFMKGNHDKAIADCDQAIQLDPNFSMSYDVRGKSHFHKENFDKAIADLDKAIQSSPNDASMYFYRARAYVIKGLFGKAIIDLDQVIQLEPKNSNAYALRGSAYADFGDFDKAIEDLKTALRINPGNVTAQKALEIVQEMKNGTSTPPPPSSPPKSSTPPSTPKPPSLPSTSKPTSISSSSPKSSKPAPKPKSSRPTRYYDIKPRIGAKAAVSIQNIKYDYGSGNTLNDEGFGALFGGIASIPLGGWVTLEPEIDFHFREFSNDEVGYVFNEGALSIPLKIRFSTSPPPYFAFYVEGGIQFDFPFGSEFTEFPDVILYQPLPMENRSSMDYGAIWGCGVTFTINPSDAGPRLLLLGYRNVINFTTFIEQTGSYGKGYFGKLFQHQVYVAVMF